MRHCENIVVVVKRGSTTALEAARQVVDIAKERGYRVFLADENDTPDLADVLGVGLMSVSDPRACKLVVIGGDGTLLRTAHKLGRNSPDIMTIGAGRRCFYFDLDSDEGPGFVEAFLRGEYLVQYYMRMAVRLENGDETPFLNEAAIVGDRAKLVRLEVRVGGVKLYDVFGDGLIVATTPGSTAYSLSAGGPVVDQLHNSTVITPLNPIQLHLRPVVMDPYTPIGIYVRKDGTVPQLIVDGIPLGELTLGSRLKIRLHPKPLRLARFRWVRFYERTFERKHVL